MSSTAGGSVLSTRHISAKQWVTEGERRFGADRLDWRFVCGCCGHVQSCRDLQEAAEKPELAYFSCVGRWTGGRDAFTEEGPGPCNYTLGGLICLAMTYVEIE